MRKAVIKLSLQIKMNLTGAARDGWRVTDEGITNDVPYISDLNKGSSQQAPSNFIEQTILNEKDVRVVGAIVQQK